MEDLTGFQRDLLYMIAGLVRQLDEGANPQQVLETIRGGAEAADNRGDSHLGTGRVNALNTVERL